MNIRFVRIMHQLSLIQIRIKYKINCLIIKGKLTMRLLCDNYLNNKQIHDYIRVYRYLLMLQGQI